MARQTEDEDRSVSVSGPARKTVLTTSSNENVKDSSAAMTTAGIIIGHSTFRKTRRGGAPRSAAASSYVPVRVAKRDWSTNVA